jgi:hypothetical protein
MRATIATIVAGLCACAGETEIEIPIGYHPLVTGDWMMAAGQEGYYCARATTTEDIFIKSFRPIAPIGTHHTALAYSGTPGSDGTFPCGASDTGFKLLFGSGLGTEPFSLPDGVAFKLPAGEQVLLNLHLYNTTDVPIAGTSGIEIERVAPDDVVHEAETIYALGFELEVPPGASTSIGSCTLDGDSTIFGVFPHMHKLGTHMKVTAVSGGVETVFHDKPYDFESQLNYEVSPLALARGTELRYACSFMNPTSQTVSFGDSTDAEMCVLGAYRYPARGTVSLCID